MHHARDADRQHAVIHPSRDVLLMLDESSRRASQCERSSAWHYTSDSCTRPPIDLLPLLPIDRHRHRHRCPACGCTLRLVMVERR